MNLLAKRGPPLHGLDSFSDTTKSERTHLTMPYIKYQGGECPESIAECVSYEDPAAPCYEGLIKLSAEARRVAERDHVVASERAKAMREYKSSHPYRGLEHVGGVGLVERGPLSAYVREIPQDEYRQIRARIETANRKYFSDKAEELTKRNDAHRRASNEHESLGWRTRIWIVSYTQLQHHVPYPICDLGVAYLRVRNEHSSGLTEQLIDIYHQAEGDVDEALLQGTDRAEVLTDLLALTGYGAAHFRVVSTTVPSCAPLDRSSYLQRTVLPFAIPHFPWRPRH